MHTGVIDGIGFMYDVGSADWKVSRTERQRITARLNRKIDKFLYDANSGFFFLAISHFHSDHYNGLKYLLNNPAKRPMYIFLPRLSKAVRLAQLVTDPALGDMLNGLRRGPGGGAPGGPEGDETGENGDYIYLVLDPSSYLERYGYTPWEGGEETGAFPEDVFGGELDKVDIYILQEQGSGGIGRPLWKFIFLLPWYRRDVREKLERLLNKFAKQGGFNDTDELVEHMQRLVEERKIDEFENLAQRLSKFLGRKHVHRFNLMLIHYPTKFLDARFLEIGDYCYCCGDCVRIEELVYRWWDLRRLYCPPRVGFLLTGDALLDAKQTVIRLARHLPDGCIIGQVPHHGSRYNSNRLLFRLGDLWVIPSDPNGFYRHPDSETICKIFAACRCAFQVIDEDFVIEINI